MFLGNSVQYEGACRFQCPISLAYKPVCSSENLVYANIAALKCSALRNPERSEYEYEDELHNFLRVTASLKII
jgi:hypothetical protein